MIKKALIVLAILAAVLFFAANILTQKAPGFLRSAIEKALNKTVIIQSIDYHFPNVFELEGFEVRESGFFRGETSFYVDQIRLEVSLLSLTKKKLILNAVLHGIQK